MGCAQNCGAFWNCCACTGVGNKGEDITYYMYKLIDNVKKLRGGDEPAALGSVV